MLFDDQPQHTNDAELQPAPGTKQTNSAARGHIHIDRITVCGPLDHQPIGAIFYKEAPNLLGVGDLMPAGSQAYSPSRRGTAPADDIFVQSKQLSSEGTAQKLLFDCCPPQVLQGHNMFGHGDLASYVGEIFDRQLVHHGLTASPEERAWWHKGSFVTLTELHLCGNHWCPPDLKPSIFNAIDQNNPRGKKRELETMITLGLTAKGERSKYHNLSVYDKLMLLIQQWKAPGEKQRELLHIAQHSLRAEVKLYAQWLNTYAVDPPTGEILNYREALKKEPKRAQRLRRLSVVESWAYVDIKALFYRILGGYEVANSVQRMLTEDEQRDLSTAARRAYTLWLHGEDLCHHYGKSARSTHAHEIWEKFRVDITAKRRPDRLPAVNVGDILRPEQLVPVPACLLNSPYYWNSPGL